MWYEWIASNYDDLDLTPSNIKDWVDIFGVEGTFEGSGNWSFWTLHTIALDVSYINYYQVGNMIILASSWNVWTAWYYNDANTRQKICEMIWFSTVVSYIHCTKKDASDSNLYLTQYWNDGSRHFSSQFWTDELLSMICS